MSNHINLFQKKTIIALLAVSIKKVFQTRYGKGEGNCFQAALASLFELKLEDVPDFCNIYETEDSEEWYEKFVEWLRMKGYSSLPVKADDLARPNYKDCFLLVTGKNAKGVNHCVIYLNGKITHNPNKKCKGIKPKTIDLIFPLNPVLKLKEQKNG